MGAVALALLLLACGTDAVPDACPDECPAPLTCDEATGLCHDLGNKPVPAKNITARFDADRKDGQFHALVYDRLVGAFLFGTMSDSGPPDMDWELVATASFDDPLYMPRVKLLFSPGTALALLELKPGAVSLATKKADSWSIEPLLQLGENLSLLDAVYVPEIGFDMCASDENGRLLFATWDGDYLASPEEIVLAGQSEGVAPPAAVVRLAGRTTILAAGTMQGLLSLSRSQDTGWTAQILDPDVSPVAIAVQQTAGGLVAAYLDGETGDLLYASGESDQVAIQLVDTDIVSEEFLEDFAPHRLALETDAITGTVYLAYFHQGDMALHLRRRKAPDQWPLVAAQGFDNTFVPALAFTSKGVPVGAGVRLPPAGQTGPGVFEIVLF